MKVSDVLDQTAALLNDVDKQIFTYDNLLPYFKIAYDEMAEEFENSNVPLTNEVSSVLAITTDMTDIGGDTGPALPDGLIEIRGLYERLTGTEDDFVLMSKVEFLPPYTVLQDALVFWTWQNQTIQFLGATTDRDVRMNYIGNTLPSITDENTTLTTINCKTFLSFRTAALGAMYIGENQTRATALQGDAQNAMDRLLNLPTKSNQAIVTRRRPFRAGYKMRGWI